MDKEQRRDAARDLLRAYETRRGIEPLTSTYTDMVLDDAYVVQLAQVEDWTGRGRRIKGHKVGLTSAAMQRMLGVDQPDFGHLTDDMFWTEFQPIPTSRFLQPRVEPEIAFVLGRDLSGPGINTAEAIRAIDFVLPALELIDSRIRDWRIKLFDTIADNASSGGVVLGSRATAPDRVDLRLVGCNLYRNGAFVDSGANGAVLGSPITALVWLANTLGVRGVTLEAGHVVLPGSCTAAMQVAPGDTVLANFAGLGGVTAVFARNGGS